MPRILIIDDEPEVRDFLVAALARAGYDAQAVANGREGVHQCRRVDVDLVITDLVMPEQEGLETIIELQREHPGLPVIAISGGARGGNEHYLEAATLCGAQRVFGKPVSPAILLAAVQDLVGPPAAGADRAGGQPGD